MDREHVRTLYREFLFRMVDRDLLSVHAQGDVNKFLGRLAAILVWISIPLGAFGVGAGEGMALGPRHSLIATTMLVVAVFAVLSWDSLFPDRRDIFVLTPLGVGSSTLISAKAAALLAGLSVSVAVFNAFPCIIYLFAAVAQGSNVLDMILSVRPYRGLASYWVTMFLAGGFVLFSIVSIQAAVSLLPRKVALRVSSFLQIAVFCTAVVGYFTSTTNTARMPSYWFLGLFHQLNGTAHDATLELFAQRAWVALGVIVTLTLSVVLIACLFVLRKIAEQPDVVPGRRNRWFSVSLGSSPLAAIIQWTARTLVRSRQHRVLVTFYCGIGFAAIILFVRTPVVQIMSRASSVDPWRDLNLPLIGASFVMTICWIVGVRAAFSIPIELRANWIFQLTLNDGPREPLEASRQSLLVAGAGPLLLTAAVAFGWLWPTGKAAQHLVVLTLIAWFLAAVVLRGFHKIPFTCAYLPGTSHIHITLAACVMLGLNVVFWSATFERRALYDTRQYLLVVATLAVAAAVGWLLLRLDRVEALSYEDEPPGAILKLGLGPGA